MRHLSEETKKSAMLALAPVDSSGPGEELGPGKQAMSVASQARQEFYGAGHPTRILCAPVLTDKRPLRRALHANE